MRPDAPGLLTRAQFLMGTIATVATTALPNNGANAVSERVEPRFSIPSGATDCHVHVFAPEQFPFSPRRSYTPGPASVDDLLAFEHRIGMSRCVLVQPSPYGADNACLLASLQRLGPMGRGVAVIDPEKTQDAELEELGRAGVRSVRVNLEAQGNRDPGSAARALEAVGRRVAARGWSIQVYAGLHVIAELADQIAALPVPFVADHFGGARAEGGTGQPGFDTLVRLVRSGKVYVKLSAPYRSSQGEPDYDDMAPIARALIGAAPEQMIWASDWPHTGGGATGSNDRSGRSLADIEPFRTVDVARILALLAEWCPDEQAWCRILVDNPTRLYSFA